MNSEHEVSGPVDLATLVTRSEEWLMARILGYAKQHGFTQYTSTLMEAWRISIVGLNDSLVAALKVMPAIPALGAEDRHRDDPVASFGIKEAKLHRQRGVTLAMFLGLMKYYRQSYVDLILAQDFTSATTANYCSQINRFFDRIELGFCSEWVSLTENDRTDELQSRNRLLTNEKNKYLTIFESLHVPVLILDEENRLHNMNHAWATTFSGGSVPGAEYYRPAEGAGCPGWVVALLRDYSAGQDADWETEAVLATSRGLRYFQIRVKQMLDVSEKFSGTVIIFHDVDKLKKAEQELAKAYEELKYSHSQMLHQEKMASIGQLAAGVAHEINNPVAFVASNLNTLKKYGARLREYIEAMDSWAAGYAEDARAWLAGRKQELKIGAIIEDLAPLIDESLDGTRRVAKIVSDLMGFSRLEDEQAVNADINECIEQTLNICWNELKYKAEVHKDFGRLPPVHCYPQQLNQVFLNLLINAGQAIEEKGAIFIRTWADELLIHVAIRDTGCGIAPEKLPRIFEPFFTTKEVGRGTGLGLSISYDIIEKHQGTITVQSQPGAGTTFEVAIPHGAGFAGSNQPETGVERGEK